MATKGVKRRQKKSAVEAVGPPLAWGAYCKGLAAQQKVSQVTREIEKNKEKRKNN
jgi:hypothetical protein